jgi:hypothetical protein
MGTPVQENVSLAFAALIRRTGWATNARLGVLSPDSTPKTGCDGTIPNKSGEQRPSSPIRALPRLRAKSTV